MNPEATIYPMHQHTIREQALSYIQSGFSVIPLNSPKHTKFKAPFHKDWPNLIIDKSNLDQYFPPQSLNNIGLLLGKPHPDAPNLKLTCIDIDSLKDDNYIKDRVLSALPKNVYPIRNGNYNRIQILCYSDYDQGKERSSHFAADDYAHASNSIGYDEEGKELVEKCKIEIFTGLQCMLPPSYHTEAGKYMEWLDAPLSNYTIYTLPFLSKNRISELLSIILSPKSSIHKLYSTDKGSMHLDLVAAIGSMINDNWSDQEIYERMDVEWNYHESLYTKWEWTRSGFDKECKNAIVRDKFEKNSHPSVAARAVTQKRKRNLTARDHAENWVSHRTVNKIPPMRDEFLNIRMYENGRWKTVLKNSFLYDFGQFIQDSYASQSKEVYETLVLNVLQELPPPADPFIICTKDCSLYLLDKELSPMPHSPDNYLRLSVPHSFEMDLPCPNYTDLLNSTFKQKVIQYGDNRIQSELDEDTEMMMQTWEEYAGYTLFPNCNYQKFLFLFGQPDAGKSKLAETLHFLLPPEGISVVALDDMRDNKGKASVLQSMLNIDDDTSANFKGLVEFVKKIASGGRQAIKLLYKESDSAVVSTAKLVFLSNNMVFSPDLTNSFNRRVLPLLAPNVVSKGKKDANLAFKLRAEASAICSRYIQGAARLAERGGFMSSNYESFFYDECRKDSNPAALWFENFEYAEGNKEWTPERCYLSFLEMCKYEGIKYVMTKRKFGMALNSLPDIGERIRPKICRCPWDMSRSVEFRPIRLKKEHASYFDLPFEKPEI